MALPELRPPDGTPCFLVAGHAITPDSLYEDIDVIQGHGRKRRVQTYAPRYVNVSLILEEDEAEAYDDWFENALIVGNELFTAEIAELGVDSRYWAAQWVAPPEWQPMHLGRWRVSGQLLLTGDGSDEPPYTATLAVEYGVELTGSAALTVAVNFAIEYVVALFGVNPFAIEYEAALTGTVVSIDSFELREDSSYELREDGSKELRD